MEEEGHQKNVEDWLLKGKDKGCHDGDNAGKEESLSRRNHLPEFLQCRSPSASSSTCKEVRSRAAKLMADNALKSVPQFSGGQKEFIDWQQAEQTFINAGYFSVAAAFQLLKKTLHGRSKKLVKKM
jgi:hypothetical protein